MSVPIKISSKGQVVIPKDIRDALQLRAGGTLNVSLLGDRIVMQPAQPVREKISYEEFRGRGDVREKGATLKPADTNVLLRIITGDDPAQEAVARNVIAADGLLVSLTVLMEIEWVLRSRYRWDRHKIANALESLASLEGLHLERVGDALWAVECMRAGADLTDMVHLLVRADVEAFVTFDRAIAPLAGDALLRVEVLA